MSNELSWDDVEMDDEDFTEEEAKEIEDGGRPRLPVGLYLCEVVESTPKQIDFNAYSCLGVTLKFEIIKALEIEGEKVTDAQGESFEGLTINDDIAFADTEGKEKDGMRKRRKYVALRLGLIQPGEKLSKAMWRDRAIGKKVKLQLEENRYIDKKTNQEKIGFPQIGFFSGYHRIDAEDQESQVPAWDDI